MTYHEPYVYMLLGVIIGVILSIIAGAFNSWSKKDESFAEHFNKFIERKDIKMFKSKGKKKKFYFSKWQFDRQKENRMRLGNVKPTLNHVFIEGEWLPYTLCMDTNKTAKQICPKVTDIKYLGEAGEWDIAVDGVFQNKSITERITK